VRPAVGITTSTEEILAAGWTETAAFSPLTYVHAVQRAGARAVLLVPDARVEDALAGIDAVILSGGASDVNAGCYGAEPHPLTGGREPERDAFEIALVRLAAQQGVPVLGICRGMQVINVAYGGTLVQHLPDLLGHDEHRAPGDFSDHEVRVAAGTLAAQVVGRGTERVRSHHHQGIERVGEGLAVSGWSSADELPEVIEDADGRFVLGVQWHPEEDEASQVVRALVDHVLTARAPQA
jgi:putative glutamine amidotransferase